MNIGTRIKNLFAGMWNNTEAVSPIVATLVLVTVAIAGAAGVGMIQGTFTAEMSDDVNTEDLISAAQTEILIAGSTTVQPVSELIAEAYMADNAGVRITVQGGGSGAGISSTGLDIVDIGAASRDIDPTKGETEKYPDIVTHKIGGSAVVVIAGSDIAAFNITHANLKTAYKDNAPDAITESGDVTVNTTLYQRTEESGTEDTFTGWLNKISIDGDIEGATGNAGVLAAVQGNADSIGFVDFGFADGASDIVILGIVDEDVTKIYGNATITSTNLKKELSGAADKYPDKLARPLNYMTNGEPNSMVQAFITFAQSPGATPYFEACGYFPVTTIA